MPKAKHPHRTTKAAKTKPPLRRRAETAQVRELWTLVVIAQEPVRQAVADRYRQANALLDELRGIIERDATVDRPAFGGWLAANFGALLTALREVEAQINEKAPMLEAIRVMNFLSGCSPREAYDEIMRGKQADERRTTREAAGEPVEADEDDEDLDDEDLFAGMPDELKRMFGFGAPQSGGAKQGSPPPEDDTEPDAPPRSQRPRRRSRPIPEPTPDQRILAQRLKTAYRAVVRRLHPDVRTETSAYDQQLWHEAQRAYEQSDLERLETILAVSELTGDGALPAGAALGGLLALTRQVEASIRQLERRIGVLKKDLAWNFSALVSREKLRQKVGTRLRQDVAAAKAELAAIEGDLAVCREMPLPRRRGSTPKQKPRQSRKKKNR